MNTQSNSVLPGKLSVVSAQKMNTTVQPESPDRLGPRVLEMMGYLQTTLEICQQIEIFARETAKLTSFSGIAYSDAEGIHACSVGIQEPHSTSYTLKINTENLGIISVYRNYAFEDNELQSFENMLCGLIYPLRNALMYHSAIDAATTDPLTGIYNRATYDQTIQREFGLAKRNNAPLSILVVDIDHFKLVNDNYGHTMGDATLRAVAHSIQSTIRGSDILFRYGGEEFVVLLSNTAINGAKLLADRIREEISHIGHINSIELDVTASIGVTELLASDKDTETLFSRADKALYSAKNSGRNKVVSG